MNISFLRTVQKGKESISQIKRNSALCDLRKGELPKASETYISIFKDLDDKIKVTDKRISQGALNNVHGDWYEWVLAIEAWNFCYDNKLANLPVILPNISAFDVSALYETGLFEYVTDLRDKVKNASGVHLITSNPDFVIIKRTLVDKIITIGHRIDTLDIQTLKMLNNIYSKFEHKCSFLDIVGYVSVKTSLRPDRRLQLSHEGSLMKALYVHLQTREWILNPPGLKYYAITMKASGADMNGLKTVATHSLTTVQSIPEPAVDSLLVVNTPAQCVEALEKILY